MEIATTAKAAAGGGAAVIGGSAVGVGIAGSAPYASVLAEAENFESIYKGKYGDSGNNKNLFVDPNKNQKGGEYKYNNSEKTNDNKKLKLKNVSSEEFGKVELAFSDSDDKALNKVCDRAFTSSENTIALISGYKQDIGRYCSKGGTVSDVSVGRPLSISVVSNDTSKFIGKNENRGKFVDSDNASNKKGGNWIYENVLVHDKTKDDTHPLFKAVDKGYSENDGNALNKVCKVAYEKRYQEVTNIKYKKGIWKYCSKEGNEPVDIEIFKPSLSLIYYQDSSADGSIFEKVKDNVGKFVDDISSNEEGGNGIYENKYLVDKDSSSNMSTQFKAAVKGYAGKDDNSNGLNKICKTVYNSAPSSVTDQYKTDAWKYCSKDGSEPANKDN